VFAFLGSISLAMTAPEFIPGKVHPRVWAETAEDRSSHFLVLLQDQADPAGIAWAHADPRARGRALVAALRERADHTQGSIRALLHAHGATNHTRYWIVNMIAAEGGRRVVEALARRDDVRAVESDAAFRVPLEQVEDAGDARSPTPDEATSGGPKVEPGLAKIGASNLWALGFTGQGIVYANADTGVQWSHPALKPRYRGWNGTNANHGTHWWDAVHSDLSGNGTNPHGFSLAAPADDNGHGTHTMGTGIGSEGTNLVGVAPGARWIACRNMEEGWGRASTYLECLQFFLAPTDASGRNPNPDLRPDVVGNSYTCPALEACSADSLHLALQNLRAAGVFLAVSAGNYAPSSCDTIRDPPGLDSAVITVGATDLDDTIAGFSGRGPVTIDGSNRRKPDLVAPGVGVRSAYPNNRYVTLNGTSMAAPHLAGAVALLWSALPSLRRNVSATQTIFEQTAVPLATSAGCGGDLATNVPNNVYGYGRIDVLAAYASQNRPPVASNQVVSVEMDSLASLSLKGRDPEGAALTFHITVQPLHGLLQGLNPTNGSVTYVPEHAFAGNDGFAFAVKDGVFFSTNGLVRVTVTRRPDTDGDGLPDYWETANAFDPNAPGDAGTDADQDGLTNLEEYRANTNPRAPGSVFRIVRAGRDTAGRNTIVWDSVGATRYRVQYSDEGTHAFLSFEDIARPASEEVEPAIPGTASRMVFTDDFTRTPRPQRTRYYRIRIVP